MRSLVSRTSAAALAAHLAVLVSVASCNQILGNEGGKRGDAAGPGVDAARLPDAQTLSDAETPRDAATLADASDCLIGTKRCGDRCASTDNPQVGCARPGCEKCDAPGMTDFTCDIDNGACVGVCDETHDACDDDPSNGCDTDLHDPNNCGACGDVCDADETCGPVPGEGFLDCVGPCYDFGENFHMCVDGCTDFDDVSSCGSCGMVCGEGVGHPAVCEDGHCGVDCEDATFAKSYCHDECVDATVGECGVRCLDCRSYIDDSLHVTNATACEDGVCSFTCTAGWANDDAVADNGCEARL